jgi:hypothetical protein
MCHLLEFLLIFHSHFLNYYYLFNLFLILKGKHGSEWKYEASSTFPNRPSSCQLLQYLNMDHTVQVIFIVLFNGKGKV